MPKITTLSELAGVMPYYYNVSVPVGAGGGALYGDDVLMVQWMLKEIFDKHPKYNCSKPQDAMKLDGICGRITLEYIEWFQARSNLASPLNQHVSIDRRVDVAPEEKFSTPKGYVYTIILMNMVNSEVNPGMYSHGKRPSMPSRLETIIRNLGGPWSLG